MRAISHTSDKSFGVKICKSKETGTSHQDVFKNKNSSITVPFGELLFSIIESIDLLEVITFTSSEKINQKVYSDYFFNKEYDLTQVFIESNLDKLEVVKLKQIRNFLEKCNDDKSFCSNDYLKALAVSVLSRENPLFNLFKDKTSKYLIRQFISEFPIPFGYTTAEIKEMLDKEFFEYEFFTQLKVNSLSELCIASLFEIFECGYVIRKCLSCGKFFTTSNEKKLRRYCNRPSEKNDFRGCFKFRAYLYNQNYSSTVIKEYRKIYNRLKFRTRSKKNFDIQVLNEFKSGWIKLNKEFKNKQDKEQKQKEYLSSERWN